jgi:hypothetical protein
MRRKKKGGVSGIVKTIPLSVALAALSTGAAFADAPQGAVQVDMGNGSVYQFDLSLLEGNSAYATQVRTALEGAFTGGRSITVQVGDDKWLEFSENATAELTLDDIKNATGNDYRVDPDPAAVVIPPLYNE